MCLARRSNARRLKLSAESMSDVVLIMIIIVGVIGLVAIVLAVLAYKKPEAAKAMSSVIKSAAEGAAQVIGAFAPVVGAARGLPSGPDKALADGPETSEAHPNGEVRPTPEVSYG